MTPHIWVDADACPNVIKDILFKVALRRQIHITLVANISLSVPTSPLIKTLVVPAGFNEADDEIVRQVAPGDLVITADIPLADAIVAKGATGLNPRGELYTEDNVKGLLRMRNLMEELRSGGMVAGGPPPIGSKDKQQFTNQLDRFLTRNIPKS
ncbi:YaiI/YqxD family protein [Pseudodesulfovibrio sp. JC047]|uniref:YaiI/YqxD family protein n=1 Tax=Pseudodesulfovibrio sp. JC047 TaxID=2683199 RepID=UPI0013D339B2|nr:YaiI/YqxD family protein [Pseudodesulfovibrio sp. JC047]NDV20427.1 YaiI/YqxD family protein [Pseudodesulfovibrio sp. JC047]